jgi:hypothetical protein
MKSIILTLAIFLVSLSTALAQNNEVLIEQVGQNNNLEGVQDGRNNTADVYQMNGHYANIEQNGVGNTAMINQLVSGSFAELIQDGSTNVASINQGGNHSTNVYQSGKGNTATVNQSGDRDSMMGFVFNPPGNPDVCPPAFGTCSGGSENGSTSYIAQKGMENNAEVNQTGAFWAMIEQDGNFNEASITQNLTGIGSGTNVSAQIYQMNDGNTASITQNVLTVNPIVVNQTGVGAPVHIVHN